MQALVMLVGVTATARMALRWAATQQQRVWGRIKPRLHATRNLWVTRVPVERRA